jgi:hypothetical protein
VTSDAQFLERDANGTARAVPTTIELSSKNGASHDRRHHRCQPRRLPTRPRANTARALLATAGLTITTQEPARSSINLRWRNIGLLRARQRPAVVDARVATAPGG